MAISGWIGAGAQQGLEDLFRQQLLQQQLEQRQREADQEAEARAAALSENRRQFDREQSADQAAAESAMEERAAGRRQVMNVEGLRRMDLDRDRWEGEQMAEQQAEALLALPPEVQARIRPLLALGQKVSGADLEPEDRRISQQRAETDEAIRKAGGIAEAEERARAKYRPVEPSGASTRSGGRASQMDARIQDYTFGKTDEALSTVNEILGKASRWNTGWGSLLSSLPTSEARAMESVMNQLRGQIAFKELAAMRAASPTGGALGQVSERELDLLSSSAGGLDPAQSTRSFKQQLEKVRRSLERVKADMTTVTAPDGTAVRFPTPAAAAAFRSRFGGGE